MADSFKKCIPAGLLDVGQGPVGKSTDFLVHSPITYCCLIWQPFCGYWSMPYDPDHAVDTLERHKIAVLMKNAMLTSERAFI